MTDAKKSASPEKADGKETVYLVIGQYGDSCDSSEEFVSLHRTREGADRAIIRVNRRIRKGKEHYASVFKRSLTLED